MKFYVNSVSEAPQESLLDMGGAYVPLLGRLIKLMRNSIPLIKASNVTQPSKLAEQTELGPLLVPVVSSVLVEIPSFCFQFRH
jgi:hypothetical protein